MAEVITKVSYFFCMGDGTPEWKISRRSVEDVEGVDGETIPMLSLAPYDWGFVDLVMPRSPKERRGTLVGCEGLLQLIAMRNEAVEQFKFLKERDPPTEGARAKLFDAEAEAPGKRKRYRDENNPPTICMDVTMPERSAARAGECMSIEVKFPVKPLSTLAVKLETSTLEFVVLFVRCFDHQRRTQGRSSHGGSASETQASTQERDE